MDLNKYLGEIKRCSKRSIENQLSLASDLRDAVSQLDQVTVEADPIAAAGTILNVYNILVAHIVLLRSGEQKFVTEEMIEEISRSIQSFVCSDAALSIAQIADIIEWCGDGNGGGGKIEEVLEVYGGSGYNASVLSSIMRLPVKSVDISPADAPDFAGCESEEDMESVRQLIDYKIAHPEWKSRTSFDVEKMDSEEAVVRYASSSTLLFMGCPPKIPGVVEKTISAFYNKGGRYIAVIGNESDGRPLPSAWTALRLHYEENTDALEPMTSIPIIPGIAFLGPDAQLPSLRLFERK